MPYEIIVRNLKTNNEVRWDLRRTTVEHWHRCVVAEEGKPVHVVELTNGDDIAEKHKQLDQDGANDAALYALQYDETVGPGPLADLIQKLVEMV